MTRDYVKKSPKRKRRAPRYSGPSVLHVLSVLMLAGLFGLGVFYLKKVSTHTTPHRSLSIKHPHARHTPAHAAHAGPSFEFYSLLSKPQHSSSVARSLPAPIVHHRYALRLATVKNEQHADALRAKCALMGFKLMVTPIQKENTTWYRIQTTPFKDRLSAETAQERLREQNIDSMVLESTKAGGGK